MAFIFLFFIGSALASFINVVIDRLPRGESLFFGRSYCENCKKQIKWFDLVPVFSYIFLSGKCRNCKKKIPIRIFLVELAGGITFIMLYPLFLTNLPAYFLTGVILLLFLSIAVIDYYKRIIFDVLLVLIGVLSIILILFTSSNNLWNHFLAGLISFLFFFILFIITKFKGIGFGDVKMAFFMGLFLGGWLAVLSFYIAFLTGALISIILVLSGKKKLKGASVPFGPFLAFGVYISALFGQSILKIIFSYFQL